MIKIKIIHNKLYLKLPVLFLLFSMLCLLFFSNFAFIKNADSVVEKALESYETIKNCNSTETVITEFIKTKTVTKKETSILLNQKILYSEYSFTDGKQKPVLRNFYFYPKDNNTEFVSKTATTKWERILNEKENNYYFYSSNTLANYKDLLSNIKSVTKIVELSYKHNRVYVLEGYLNSTATRRWLLFEGYGTPLENLGYDNEYITKYFSNVGMAKFKIYINSQTYMPFEYFLDFTIPRNKLVTISADLAKNSKNSDAKDIYIDLLSKSSAQSYTFNSQISDINTAVEYILPQEVLDAKVR